MKRLIKLAVWAFACSVGLAQAGELTLSTTGYTGSFLTDFPVLVRLSEAKMTGFKYAEAAQENIRFLSPDGQTEYPREIEHWNPEGESLIWVKLPFLSSRTSFKFVWGGESTTTVKHSARQPIRIPAGAVSAHFTISRQKSGEDPKILSYFMLLSISPED